MVINLSRIYFCYITFAHLSMSLYITLCHLRLVTRGFNIRLKHEAVSELFLWKAQLQMFNILHEVRHTIRACLILHPCRNQLHDLNREGAQSHCIRVNSYRADSYDFVKFPKGTDHLIFPLVWAG